MAFHPDGFARPKNYEKETPDERRSRYAQAAYTPVRTNDHRGRRTSMSLSRFVVCWLFSTAPRKEASAQHPHPRSQALGRRVRRRGHGPRSLIVIQHGRIIQSHEESQHCTHPLISNRTEQHDDGNYADGTPTPPESNAWHAQLGMVIHKNPRTTSLVPDNIFCI